MKHLKLFFALFAMLALGVGNAWGAEVKWDLTTTSYSSSNDDEVIWSSSYVTATAIKGDGTKVTNYLAKSSQTRLYNKNTLSITPVSGYSINSIVIAATGNSYVIKGTWTNGTSSTSDKIVTITPTDGTKTISCAISATCRLTEIKVIYESTSGGGETPEPTPVTVSLNKTELSLQAGATETLTATVTGSTEAVTWSSSATGVAAVDDAGKVTAVAAGEATITAAIGDVKATCSVTVTASTPEEPGTGGEETWTLVTNASDLKAGDQVVIAAKDYNYAISTTQNSNNRGQASITKSGDNITFGSDVQILTLEAGTKSSTFGLNTGSGYLYASSSSGNQLKTQATNNDNGSWSISISSGTATIKANGTNSRNVMQYNQSSSLFACYSSASQKALAIYKKVTSTDEPGSGETVVLLIPKNGYFEGLLSVQLLALFLQQKDSFSATLQVPPCTRW